MAGKIPQAFIDELMNRVDIVDVVDARVPLKKAGREFTACCPFHNEKTPSFTVSQTKQFYHCFGCGAHGTALGFLMDYEHLGFIEAVEELAAAVGLEVPREAGTSVSPEAGGELYEVLSQAAAFYRKQLRDHAEAGKAIDYLKRRGLSGEIAAEFGVGYAPGGWSSLAEAMGSDETRRRQLLRAGLIAERSGGGVYDRFRDRIMFPIRDRRGRVIAFGGRILDGDGPKYLNSPETAVFHKGRELYGLFEARKALRHPSRLMVVEGYMDVVALAQFGIRYAVATLGTATTRDHLEALYRVVPEVVFCFDGDRAGREAAWRALENALPVMRDGRQAAFLFLPDGEDPDTLVRKEGREAFEQRIAQAVPFSEFFFEALGRQADTRTVDGRARLAELARPLLARLPESVFKHMLVRRLSEIVNLPQEQLSQLLQDKPPQRSAAPEPRPRGNRASSAMPKVRTPVRLAVALLLQQPELANEVDAAARESLRGIELPGVELLLRLLEILHQEPHLRTAALLERWRDSAESVHLMRLAQVALPGEAESLRREFQDTVSHLVARGVDQRWEFLQSKLAREGLSAAEKAEWKQILDAKRQRPPQG